MSSSKFGRYLLLNWHGLYLKTGAVVWLGKAGSEIKNELDKYSSKASLEKDVLAITGISLLYYSPNVLVWPVNFAIDGYKWGVIKYYENKKT